MKPGDRIRSLQGPILVLGASGFVGANLARTLLEHRADVVATTSRTPAWRLEDLPARNVREFDALVALNVDRMLDEVQPRTVFNCIAYGAYSFETDGELILRTNLMSTHALLERLAHAQHRGLHPRRQLVGVRRERGRARGARLPRRQQRVRRLEGRLRAPHPLLRQAARPARGATCACTRSTGRSRIPRG